MRCFGKRVSERNIRSYCETTPEQGPNEEGIIYCLKCFKLIGTRFETSDKDAAWNKITRNSPSILCVQNYAHWITAIGTVNDKLIIIDPTNTVANKSENGIHVVKKKDFLEHWRGRDNKYYGIMVTK